MATVLDKQFLEFYGVGSGAAYNGQLKGTFNLGAAGDNNYATCSRCLRLVQDGTKLFFQQSGTLVVAATSDQINGTVNATITNTTLVEVTIDANYVSTPVPGGACLHITSATAAAAVPTGPPAGWNCDPGYYADGSCDCGCGKLDYDCDSGAVGVCDYCNDPGSCNTLDCPGTINTTNNSVCGP